MAVFQWRPAQSRHCIDQGWRRSLHTFACEEWCDPRHLGVGALRGLSEVYLAPGPTSLEVGPRPLDLFVLPLDGPLACRIEPGAEQLDVDPSSLLWLPARDAARVSLVNPTRRIVRFVELRLRVAPRPDDASPLVLRCEAPERADHFAQLACAAVKGEADGKPDAGGAVLYRTDLGPERTLARILHTQSQYYLQVLNGEVLVNRQPLATGDGIYLTGQGRLVARNLSWMYSADLLLVELPIER